ncbi:helix-turn-helix domain-containing protein [Nocardiopsis sp. CC223A]|uniref:helix-turn-helix domain-containing protein n=1 Tax=Nocardiopsis sp. CC223A TaxID=3044051 RepID=UPI00278BECC4|nr:helix-turn-helix domain-containing protein [Nocardiopsis sp. CC223A]
MTDQQPPPPELMTPEEVAARFRVDPKTVKRWARVGMLPSVRTPSGKYRFHREAVNRLLRQTGATS